MKKNKKTMSKKLIWLLVVIGLVFIADLVFVKQPFKLSSLSLGSLRAAVSTSTAAINGRVYYYEVTGAGPVNDGLRGASLSVYGVPAATAVTDSSGGFYIYNIPTTLSGKDFYVIASKGRLRGVDSTISYVFKVNVPLNTSSAKSVVLDLKQDSTIVLGAGAPHFPIHAALNPVVANSASFDNTKVTKNTSVSLFGLGLTTTKCSTSSAVLPTTLCNMQVFVDNTPVGISSVTATQVNLVMPDNLTVGKHNLEMRFLDAAQALRFKLGFSFDSAKSGFGLFTTNQSGKGQGSIQNFVFSSYTDQANTKFAVLNNSRTVTTTSGPLVRKLASGEVKKDIMILYGTGLGAYRNNNLPRPIAVLDGNNSLKLETIYQGVAPGFAGLDQINVAIPKNLVLPVTPENKHTVMLCDEALSNCSNKVDVYIK